MSACEGADRTTVGCVGNADAKAALRGTVVEMFRRSE
jgi:hypothetical protein